jgi:hypothetical protein
MLYPLSYEGGGHPIVAGAPATDPGCRYRRAFNRSG